MRSLAITLKKLRESRDMTMEILGEKAGVSKGIIGEIERGATRSSVKTLNKIAEALKLNEREKKELDEAFLGREIKESVELKLNTFKLISIPVYSSVAAGVGYITDATPVGYINIPEMQGDCVGIKVVGDSMEPTFYNNDIVVIKKDIEVMAGEIGVFLNKNTGEAYVKRLKNKNGTYVLESDNKIFQDIVISSEEFICCGKVINVVRRDLKKRTNHLHELIDDIPPNKIQLAKKLLETLLEDEN